MPINIFKKIFTRMVIINRIEIVALFLWMCVFGCYGQTDSVTVRTIHSNEIREKHVVESMDSITDERVTEQIILQQFVESLEEINESCPMEMKNLGNVILDSMSFEYPQVIYHLSMHSKDYQEKPMEIVKEEGALQILLARSTKLFRLIRQCNWGLTYYISFLDKEGGTTVLYAPEEISRIYSQGVPKERVLKHLSDVFEEANKLLPAYTGNNMQADSISITNGYLQSHYTVFEDKTINIKTLKKSEMAIKSNLMHNMMAENSDMYMMITSCAILDYGFIFRFTSFTKKKHFDVVFSTDEIQEIERNRLQQ